MTENELANLVERGYVPHGGSHIIHFIGCNVDGQPGCLRTAAIPLTAQARARRRGLLRTVGGILGLLRPGAADVYSGDRADAALSRPARHGRGGI